MKKLFRNRIVLACIAILLAVVIIFLIAPTVEKNAQEEVTVYVAKTTVAKGTELTEDVLKTLAVPEKYVPGSAMRDKTNIVGKYAKTDLVANDYIYPEKLSKDPTLQNDWHKEVSEEQLAVSVTIKSFAAGLSAKLEAGDVITFISAQGAEDTIIPPELRYVHVAAVTTETAQDYDPQHTPAEDTTAVLPATVTVLVTPAQATRLADLELNSTLHLALASRGNAEKAGELLRMQSEVLAQLQTIPEVPQA